MDSPRTYQNAQSFFDRAAAEPNSQWSKSEANLDQYMASQNAAPRDTAKMHGLWASMAGELLDRIGPSIIQTHSLGGPFGWLAADARPALVKGIVCVEGGGTPFTSETPWGLTAAPLAYDPPAGTAAELNKQARRLKNLTGIPIAVVEAERSGVLAAPTVDFLKQAGCDAEVLSLKAAGVLGNGHLMMLENNRKQVFEALRTWIERRVKA
jgi:pimeloyl-ACP methyl ester carboxylesterase